MGVKPIKSLLIAMGLPMILSMMLQAFYNIVDSYFVGNMVGGEAALTALTLAFPVQMLMIAIGVGTGVGINSLLSRTLGMGEREEANKIAGNAIFLGVCTYLAFLLLGIFGVNAYLSSQTSDADILALGKEYLSICMLLSFGAILAMIYEKLLQSVGRTVASTIAQIAGAVVNIVLDPIMIYGLIGFPELGVAGAAYATVIGQVLTFVLSALFHHIGNRDLNTHFRYLKPYKKIIGRIYQVGLPAIIMQALMSFMTYGVNVIFNIVSEMTVTAFGVFYKLQQFVFFAAFGMTNAQIPVIAYNYGKGDIRRVTQTIKYGLLYISVIMIIGIACFQIFASQLTGVFGLSAETAALHIAAVHIITAGWLFAGANISFQGIFQAFGKGVHSLVISLVRLIIITLPLAWTFAKLAPDAVWWTFPAAELCALIVSAVLYRSMRGKLSGFGAPQPSKHQDTGTI